MVQYHMWLHTVKIFYLVCSSTILHTMTGNFDLVDSEYDIINAILSLCIKMIRYRLQYHIHIVVP